MRPRHREGTARIVRLLVALIVVSGLTGALGTALVMPLVGSAGWAVTTGAEYFDSLPSDLAQPPLARRSVLLSRNGQPITYFFDENRVEVPLSAVASFMQQAVVAVEDSRFYQHGGIDPRGLARAAVNDSVGGKVQGASTLTQQYVKNVLVERATGLGDDVGAQAAVARTTSRKIREMRLAMSLEKRLSKPQILERYLNIVYFGGLTYGVQAAAQRYFGVSASALTLPQAALLAGMIQEPSSYDPTAHPAAARERRDVVLARMLEQGLITPVQHDQAVATAVLAKGRPAARGCSGAGVNAYFCDYVQRSILQDPAYSALGKTQGQRLSSLTRGGLVIRSTLDADLEYAAGQAVRDAVPPGDTSGLGAAAVTVEPGTGRVLAMTQNRTYAVTSGAGRTSINYSTDNTLGGATGFQTGSAFKPFTLAAWLAAGGALDDTVDATKRDFPYRAFTACGRHLRGTKPYTPGNSEGRETGEMSVLEATYNSVNVAYVDMESQLDLCDIAGLAERLGVHIAVPGRDCSSSGPLTVDLPRCLPSLTLGVKEIAPLTMAAAYAGFASGGIYCRPLPITAMTRAGATPGAAVPVAVPQPSCRRAIDQEVASGVTAALTQVLTKGTAAGVGPLPWPAAGKTGTTDGPYDTWFVGYSAQRSTAVWVADPGRAAGGGSVGRRRLTDITVDGRFYPIVYGASIAAPLWKQIMEPAMAGLPAEALP